VIDITPAVHLLVVVSNMSDEVSNEEEHSYDDVIDGRLVIRRAGSYSVDVLCGQQHVVFTAEKTKVTRTSDRVAISRFQWTDGRCTDDDSRK